MKNKYHDTIMKELHYHSGASRFMKSAFPAVIVAAVYLGKEGRESFKTTKISQDWKEVALKAVKSGQTPPQHPVTRSHTIYNDGQFTLPGTTKSLS